MMNKKVELNKKPKSFRIGSHEYMVERKKEVIKQ